MTDKELTEIIATKVMGWETMPHSRQWYKDGDRVNTGSYVGFFPLTVDEHCMMAWDKFSEGRVLRLEYLGKWEAHVLDINNLQPIFTTRAKDRRRAMCECMAKAVTNPAKEAI